MTILPSSESGSGNLTILFLHHFGGSARQWLEVASALSDEHHCITADMPGFGKAAALKGFTVAEMVDQLAALIQIKKAGRFILVGHSMTGKVAAAYAALRPSDLVGLVLVTPSPPGPEPIEDDARAEMLKTQGSRAGAQQLVDKITAQKLPPDLYERAIEDNLTASPEAWQAWLKAGSFEDWSERVGRLELPALVITGRDDPALPAAVQRRLTIPHLNRYRLVDIPSCGHLPPMEAAEITTSLLREFSRTCRSGQDP